MSPSVVVCLSGGLDSTVLAALALREQRLSACLVYRYGQPHLEAEVAAATEWCKAHRITRVLCDIAAPGGHMAVGVGVAGRRIVPGRNLAMLAHAVQYAATNGAGEVWYGATFDDRDGYPDCRPEFVRAVDVAASVYGVKVRAPLIDHGKREIVALARGLGVDIDATWSCYEPRWMGHRPHRCHTCDACVRRAEATDDDIPELLRRVAFANGGTSVEARCTYSTRAADGTLRERWQVAVGSDTFRAGTERDVLVAALEAAP